MTNEEKQLLITDLSARSYCGVKCHLSSVSSKGPKIRTITGLIPSSELVFVDKATIFGPTEEGYNIEFIKPYLRPMSSMTEEEKIKYCNLQDRFLCSSQYPVTNAYELFDWLDIHHFDYRGLIDKGLALPAPKGMY
jgi:hypothetical protein